MSFAIAVHAALLFSFTKNPRAATPGRERSMADAVSVFIVPEDEPAPAAPEASDPKSTSAPDVAPPPRSPEPGVEIRPTEIPTMDVPAFPRVDGTDIGAVTSLHFNAGTSGNAPWSHGILRSGDLDNSPRVRFQAVPVYPFEAKRVGATGDVVVEFTVDERGRVSDARVVSSTDRIFEEATLRAIAKWQFEPGRRHGRVVKFRMAVPVKFNLNEER